jgi:hypothetical protein
MSRRDRSPERLALHPGHCTKEREGCRSPERHALYPGHCRKERERLSVERQLSRRASADDLARAVLTNVFVE